MLKMEQIGPTAGDRTTLYDVILDGEYTVKTFIDAAKSHDPKWFGSIGIDNGISEIGSPRAEFGIGGIPLNEGLERGYLLRRVLGARARGGAIEHHMNYLLQLGED